MLAKELIWKLSFLSFKKVIGAFSIAIDNNQNVRVLRVQILKRNENEFNEWFCNVFDIDIEKKKKGERKKLSFLFEIYHARAILITK